MNNPKESEAEKVCKYDRKIMSLQYTIDPKYHNDKP